MAAASVPVVHALCVFLYSLLLRICNVFVVDHDDSPNSPPSVVSSQGSSVDISLVRVSFIQALCDY